MGFGDFVDGKDLIEKAKEYATEKHKGVTRKFSEEPYINHPSSVADIVKEHGGTPEMIAAAWLHDVVEDTDTPLSEIKDLFGSKIASLVDELTNPPSVEQSGKKTEYMARKMAVMSSDGLTIKLSDRLNNVSDFPTANPKFVRKYAPKTKFIVDSLEESGRPLNREQKILIAKIRKMIKPYESL